MITLGIETSCDETAVALLRGKQVLSAEIASSAPAQSEFGGIVPEIASRSHLEALLPCLDTAVRRAKIRLEDIDLIAVTQGPGLSGSLLVGVSAAKALALALRKPIVGVDHVLAHAYAGQLIRKRQAFPFLALVVSGGHTLIIHWKNADETRILGRTIDDAAGEAFDKVAKMMGLGYPGGPAIESAARRGDAAKYSFPRSFLREPNYDFSFSGLKTAVLYKLDELRASGPLTQKRISDICASFQEAVCEVLVSKAMRAIEEFRVRTLVIGGGVAANGRLHRMFALAARGKRVEIVFPTKELAADNAVMIAFLGTMLYGRRPAVSHPGARASRAVSGRTDLAFDVYPDFFVQNKPPIVYNER